MTKNKLTILVDGGWHFMRNLFFFEKGFAIDNSPAIKEATAQDFKETLARSFIKILNQLPVADNIILMSEGGSWRKQLPIPKQLEDTTYKGCRTKKTEMDWDAAYKAYSEFAENVSAAGVTHSAHPGIEGDDWAWYWSRTLNAQGINVLIWSSDCDLKQLVQTDGTTFTGWYNDKAGLVLPQNCEWPDDPMEAMMNPPFQTEILELLKRKLKKQTYINPDDIVINKILCGDAGDNIKPVVRYQKNGRNYGFAAKDQTELCNSLHINTLTDVFDKEPSIVEYICNIKKYAPYNITQDMVREMLDYNIKLVWLHESTIPSTVTSAMVQQEYLLPDIAAIKSNYKTLMGKNKTVETIFDSIFG